MKRMNLLTIWAKHVWPMFALALAMVTFSACDKEPATQTITPVYRAPYEKELFFEPGREDSIAVPVVQKYADDTACKKIYLTTKTRCDFIDGAEFVNEYRTIILEPALAVSEKVTGRGDIYIGKKEDAIYAADSIWYVLNGWKITRTR